MYGMFGEVLSKSKSGEDNSEKLRQETERQLNVMLEANFDIAQKLKKLRAELFINRDPLTQKEITTIEMDLLGKYPAFMEHQKGYPNAFKRQGSFSN
jgi:hypothetical protein